MAERARAETEKARIGATSAAAVGRVTAANARRDERARLMAAAGAKAAVGSERNEV